MGKRFAPMAALAVLVAGLLTPTAAQAATGSTHARAVTVESSAHWLVYKRQVSATNLTRSPQKGDVLYATDGAGKATQLTGFQGASTGRLSLVGDSLVQATRTGDVSTYQEQVRYRDLASGATALLTGKTDDAVQSAAPDGWTVLRPAATGSTGGSEFSLLRLRPDGTEADLGIPFPDYVDGGTGFDLVAGDSGLIATAKQVDEACSSPQVKFQPWSDPGAWRTVYIGPANACVHCAEASATDVACQLLPPSVKGLVVVSLNGGAPHYLRNSAPKLCQTVAYATSNADLVAIETTDAGSCTKGLVYRFGQNKKVALSTARYSALGGIDVGLGRILVSKGQQQVVYGLTGVTRSPTVVARA